MDASLLQLLEETDSPRTGILETAGIDQFNVFIETVVEHTAKTQSLAQGSRHARTIVLDDGIVDEAASVTVRREVVVAQPHIVAVLSQTLHLIVNLLRDAAEIGKAMIDQKQYSHALIV